MSDSAVPVEALSVAGLAEILDDVAAVLASRPQADFDDEAVLDAAVSAVAVCRRRLLS